jgi:hypothetical protein
VAAPILLHHPRVHILRTPILRTPIGQEAETGEDYMSNSYNSTKVILKSFLNGSLFGSGFFAFVFLAHYLTSFGLSLKPIYNSEYRQLLYGDVIKAIIVGLIVSLVFLRRNRAKLNSGSHCDNGDNVKK